MKKICDGPSPLLSRNRVSVSAVYDGPGVRSSTSLRGEPVERRSPRAPPSRIDDSPTRPAVASGAAARATAARTRDPDRAPASQPPPFRHGQDESDPAFHRAVRCAPRAFIPLSASSGRSRGRALARRGNFPPDRPRAAPRRPCRSRPNLEERHTERVEVRLQARQPLGIVERVDLVRRRHERFFREPLARCVAPGKHSSSRVMTS